MNTKRKKNALIQTTEDYASQTTIHGISYIFDKNLKMAGRVLWLALVLSFLSLAIYLTWNTWTQWRKEQVVTEFEDGIDDDDFDHE